jgi:ABC-type sugar transport system ATPase subunit
MTEKFQPVPALRLEGIVKTFPRGARARRRVLHVMPGEVHALMGENGAGKSTLMKVLGGIYQPDEGKIIHQGNRVENERPLEAKAKGIVFIHQELSLAEELTVAENIYLGELPRQALRPVDWGTLYSTHRRDPAKSSRSASMPAPGRRPVHRQPADGRDRPRADGDAKAVIFDEPTASLTDAEKTVLFDVIEDLKSDGVGIIYISHRMEEIFKITDRISVLRDGQYRGTLETAEDQRGRGHPDDDRPQARPAATPATTSLATWRSR